MNNEDMIVKHTLNLQFLNDRTKQVIPTAWKLGDVEFIRDGQNVNIFGMGEIHISISTLKTILETLEAN